MIDFNSIIEEEVKFLKYKKGNLWYVIKNYDFEFPVHVENMQGCELVKEGKAIKFIIHIENYLALKELELVKKYIVYGVVG